MISWRQNVVRRASGDENGLMVRPGEDEGKGEGWCRDTLHATYKCCANATVMLLLLFILLF